MSQIEEFVRKALDSRIDSLTMVECIGKQENLDLWGLDPLNIVEICADIEEQYKITIREEEIINGELKTIEDLCICIENSTIAAD